MLCSHLHPLHASPRAATPPRATEALSSPLPTPGGTSCPCCGRLRQCDLVFCRRSKRDDTSSSWPCCLRPGPQVRPRPHWLSPREGYRPCRSVSESHVRRKRVGGIDTIKITSPSHPPLWQRRPIPSRSSSSASSSSWASGHGSPMNQLS